MFTLSLCLVGCKEEKEMKNKFSLSNERKKLFRKHKMSNKCKEMILKQDQEFSNVLKEATKDRWWWNYFAGVIDYYADDPKKFRLKK